MGAKKIDSKGRITIGPEYVNKQFNIIENEDGSILLEPLVTIPLREKWLWENKAALSKFVNGIKAANEGTFSEDPMDHDANKGWLLDLDKSDDD